MLILIVGIVSSILGFSFLFTGLKFIRPDVEKLTKLLITKINPTDKKRLEQDYRHDLYCVVGGALTFAVGLALIVVSFVMKS